MTKFTSVYRLNRFVMLPVLQEWYPGTSDVFLAVEYGSGPSRRPPTYVRRRSRERHNPGDGDYWCYHARTPHGENGFKFYNQIYLTALGRTEFPRTSDGGTVWLSFDGWNIVEETFGGNRQNYDYVLRTFRGFDPRRPWVVKYTKSTWHAYSKYPTTYEKLASLAFTQEPVREDYLAGDLLLNDLSIPLLHPEIEETYMAQSISEGVEPNLGAYQNDAYMEAFNSLPQIKTNNIANLFTIFNGLKSLLTRNGLVYEGIGSLRDAWMGYRYGYSTTKADINEIAQYVDRMREVRKLDQITGHGAKSYSINGKDYTFRCALCVSVQDYLGIYDEIERFGLALDGYNAWDLIPYSFVVDWFLHIGDLLEQGRSREYAMRLVPSAAWFSTTRRFKNKYGYEQTEYFRYRTTVNLAQYPASMLGQHSTKDSTWVKRGVDAVCLFS